jgi:hypothetical protein
MAQDLTVNIKTTSDVPQAMDKAKTAVTNFDKQLSGIGQAFSNSFKSIFLSFLGPMALVGGAIALIGKLIAENQKKQEEANQSAIDGTNKLMSAEDRYFARKREKEKQSKEAIEQAKEQRETTTRLFLQNDPRAEQVLEGAEELQRIDSFLSRLSLSGFADDPKIQEKVFKIIAEDMKKNPEAGAAILDESKSGTFKGPEGFGSVIGVGANPVMEAMTRQTEVLEEIKAVLEEQNLMRKGGTVPAPFTETVPLPVQKAGSF